MRLYARLCGELGSLSRLTEGGGGGTMDGAGLDVAALARAAERALQSVEGLLRLLPVKKGDYREIVGSHVDAVCARERALFVGEGEGERAVVSVECAKVGALELGGALDDLISDAAARGPLPRELVVAVVGALCEVGANLEILLLTSRPAAGLLGAPASRPQ